MMALRRMQKSENPEAVFRADRFKGFDLGRLDKAGKVELKRDVRAVWPKSGPFELRAKSPWVPAKILDCGRRVEHHVLCHAIAHCDVGVWQEWASQSERSSPQHRRQRNNPSRLAQSVEDPAGHLAIGDRVRSRQRIDLVLRCFTGCGTQRSDRQILCVYRLA